MTGGSTRASTPRASTAVRSVRCAPPGQPTFRSSRRPPPRRWPASAHACAAGQKLLHFSSAWIGTRATVERGLRLIVEEGALDQEGATVERLAQRLGMGSRQLTRLFARHLQASPSKVARTARVQRAKRLLDETALPMTEIAMRAGFGSLRRFNSVFVEVYGRPPTKIRRTRGSAGKAEQTVEDVTRKKARFSPRARSGSAAAATSG